MLSAIGASLRKRGLRLTALVRRPSPLRAGRGLPLIANLRIAERWFDTFFTKAMPEGSQRTARLQLDSLLHVHHRGYGHDGWHGVDAELRNDLASVWGRASYAHERVKITRHGKLAAAVISVEDLEALEAYEMARDVAEFEAAKCADDGGRVSLDELHAEFAN